MPESMTNAEWFARAELVIPGGVDSPVRSFRSVGGTPYTVVEGFGAYVIDVEGRRYLDLVQSYGASLLGHADPRVVAAIAAAALPQPSTMVRPGPAGDGKCGGSTVAAPAAAMPLVKYPVKIGCKVTGHLSHLGDRSAGRWQRHHTPLHDPPQRCRATLR